MVVSSSRYNTKYVVMNVGMFSVRISKVTRLQVVNVLLRQKSLAKRCVLQGFLVFLLRGGFSTLHFEPNSCSYPFRVAE